MDTVAAQLVATPMDASTQTKVVAVQLNPVQANPAPRPRYPSGALYVGVQQNGENTVFTLLETYEGKTSEAVNLSSPVTRIGLYTSPPAGQSNPIIQTIPFVNDSNGTARVLATSWTKAHQLFFYVLVFTRDNPDGEVGGYVVV